jgi:hypothetical protein
MTKMNEQPTPTIRPIAWVDTDPVPEIDLGRLLPDAQREWGQASDRHIATTVVYAFPKSTV